MELIDSHTHLDFEDFDADVTRCSSIAASSCAAHGGAGGVPAQRLSPPEEYMKTHSVIVSRNIR